MESNFTRTLSPLEANVVLALEWEERPVVSRTEIVDLLGGSARADKVIRSLRKKRWLERLSRGRYLLIPAERGPAGIPNSNMLALARHLVEPYYLGYATAAAHYRFLSRPWRRLPWASKTIPSAALALARCRARSGVAIWSASIRRMSSFTGESTLGLAGACRLGRRVAASHSHTVPSESAAAFA